MQRRSGSHKASQSRMNTGSSRAQNTRGGRSYSAGGSSSARRRPADPRKRAASSKHRRFDPKKVHPAIWIVAAAFLLLIVYVGSAWVKVRANEHTYCSNISVNGIDLDHYTRQEGIDAVQGSIDALLNTSYTLTYGDRSWTISPSDFNAYMDATELLDRAWNIGHYGGLMDKSKAISSLKNDSFDWNVELSYDDDLVCDFIDKVYDEVYREPVNAEVTVTEERPYMTGESSTGLSLNKEAAHEQITHLLTTGEGSTMLPVEVIQPAVSSDDALGGLELIVDFSTDITFRGWYSRFNVRKALDSFNGLCIYPGETLNFNEIVGQRNEANGWQKATEYAGNGTTQEGYGGGVCQAASTLYDAMMKAGMTIIERAPHSMTVTYMEPSLDAAVTNNSQKNLVIRNDTNYAIYIYTKTDKETANVKIYGNRPTYRFELESVIVSSDIATSKVDYIYDTEGKHVYYTTDTPVLYSEGRPALISESYLLSYDWETGELMDRVQLSHDSYQSGTSIYWKGVHNADGSVIKTDK